MPTLPPRRCIKPGCPKLVNPPAIRCDEHAHNHKPSRTQYHKANNYFYSSATWRKVRKLFLGSLPKLVTKIMSLPEKTPVGMHKQLSEKSVSYCLSLVCKYDWIIEDAKETPNPGGKARYLGLNLKKKEITCQKKQS